MIFTGKLFHQIVHAIKGLLMKRLLPIIIILFIYTCGKNSSTNPSYAGPNYHSDDNAFITELVNSNTIEKDSLHNRITILAVESGNVTYDRIVTMDLSNLGLDNLPSNIKDLEYLEELDLSNNSFSDFPSELCEVSNELSTLRIEKNLLCDPTSITHCVMEDIRVDFTEQSCTLIKETQEMDFLLKFIRDNSLDSISSNIFDDIEWSWSDADSAITSDGKHIERIVEIRWMDYNITYIPSEIEDLKYLQILELEDNKLVTLPAEMKWLERLKDLQLQDNQLQALPSFIGLMTNLEELNVRGNKLTELPQSIGALNKLKFLNVGNNLLEALPDTLCGLISSGLSINIECNKLDSTVVNSCLYIQLGSQGEHANCGGD